MSEEIQISQVVINTKGKWKKFEEESKKTFEIGKTYNVNVEGLCEFAVSSTKPIVGMATNSITFTAYDGVYLWIKTL